jgi:hypothetical protein
MRNELMRKFKNKYHQGKEILTQNIKKERAQSHGTSGMKKSTSSSVNCSPVLFSFKLDCRLSLLAKQKFFSFALIAGIFIILSGSTKTLQIKQTTPKNNILLLHRGQINSISCAS